MAKTNHCRISICACCSIFAIVVNILSDWLVYYSEANEDSLHKLVSASLSNLWFWFTCGGTVIGLSLGLMECCCFFMNHKDSNEQNLRACASQWVFLATVVDDLLLVLSSKTLYDLPSNRCEIDAAESVLFALKLSSAMSLVVAMFRILKLGVLCCPNFDDCLICLLFTLHIITFIFSLVVFLISWNLTCPSF